jgi:catechol 2,3-dioxygenase
MAKLDSRLSTRATAEAPFVMHDGMSLGAPTLRVRRLQPALDFYVGRLGLSPRVREDGASALRSVELGFEGVPGWTLLTLKEDPNARRPQADFAGLYHYAVLVPDRMSLASTLLAIANSGVAYDGFADHQVSEALYLHDVEANGMEIYADRPRSVWMDWKKIGERMAATGDMSLLAPMSQSLDYDSLLGELRGDATRAKPTPFPTGARIGHMHLRVTDLKRSVEFYHEKLGLDVMMNIPQMGAAFLSAAGYHHHIGLNTWHSLGGTPHEEGEAGLEEFKVVVPNEGVLREVARRLPDAQAAGGSLAVTDPDGIRISLVSRA